MKYIALDIGNVLCEVHSDSFIREISEMFNVTIPDAGRFLKRFQQLHDLGYTTMADELIDKFDIKSSIIIDKVVNSWNRSVVPNLKILDALCDLSESSHDLQVALLSNIGIEHALMMEEKLSHRNLYPKAIKHFSCYVGARKPSYVFYQSFLLEHPEFKGCLYVDDLKENLDAGAKFGFIPFHFDLKDDNFESKIKDIELFIINS